MFKLGIVVAAAVWIAHRPGTIDIHWQDYNIHADVSIALLAIFLLIVLLLGLHRVFLMLGGVPRMWRYYREQAMRRKGYRALTLGLTAAAAGDEKMASYHAHRARLFLPDDQGLPILLEAQAARLKGDGRAASRAFESLMENKDTAFLGLRGLLQSALEDSNMTGADALTGRALKLYPKHPFVLRMVYDITLRRRHWEEAQRFLSRIEKLGAMDAVKIKSDRVALLLQMAYEAGTGENDKDALALLRRAYALDPAFAPAAQRLARYYIDHQKSRAAITVLEKTWKENPHPDLVPLWKEVMPRSQVSSAADIVRWMEKLAAFNPGAAEGHIAIAAAAIEAQMWGVARQHLEEAAENSPTTELYHLRARIAQAQHRIEESALMLRYASEAAADKTWVCRDSGHVYDSWSPVAEPHGSFNTIIWDHPRPLRAAAATLAGDDLLRLRG